MLKSIDEVLEKYPNIRLTGFKWDETKPVPEVAAQNFKDETGNVYNHLTVLERYPFNTPGKRPIWICQCDCDAKTIIITTGKSLRNGNTTSCGCAQVASVTERNFKHGFSVRGKLARIYTIWRDMIRRCTQPQRKSYRRYGARGIKVCPQWLNKETGFMAFVEWSFANGYFEQDRKTTPYSELLTIERIDNNGDYCPENCRWVTVHYQSRNRSITNWLNIAGINITAGDFAEHLGINPALISELFRKEWDENSIIHKFMCQRLGEEYHRLKDMYDRMPFNLVPNYNKLNPWSKDKTTRKLAKMYLNEEDIKWLLNIKINTKQ